MTGPSPSQINSYFSGFRGQMGTRQIIPHLTALPKWWTLVDSQGRTALMRALVSTGFEPGMLADLIAETPAITKSLAATDRGGKNLWWHLLYYYGYRSKKGQDWMPHFRERVPLQPSTSTGRGIFIDHILANPSKQWHEFFPKEGFSRMMYALPNNTHATWWGCDADDARKAAHWMLAVRQPRSENMYSLVSNLVRCEINDPNGRRTLPMPLQGALMLMEGIYGSDWARVEAAMEDGVGVLMSPRAQARLREEIKKRPGMVHRKCNELLRHNEMASLTLNTPKAHLDPVHRRL